MCNAVVFQMVVVVLPLLWTIVSSQSADIKGKQNILCGVRGGVWVCVWVCEVKLPHNLYIQIYTTLISDLLKVLQSLPGRRAHSNLFINPVVHQQGFCSPTADWQSGVMLWWTFSLGSVLSLRWSYFFDKLAGLCPVNWGHSAALLAVRRREIHQLHHWQLSHWNYFCKISSCPCRVTLV
jgi:hypothetical protein